jgi:hypothetical protein
MKKIEIEMLDAIENKTFWTKDNTSVHVNHNDNYVLVRLYYNLIAVIYDKKIVLKDGGFLTQTTKSRLNAILGKYTFKKIQTKKKMWFVDDMPFVSGMSILKEKNNEND